MKKEYFEAELKILAAILSRAEEEMITKINDVYIEIQVRRFLQEYKAILEEKVKSD